MKIKSRQILFVLDLDLNNNNNKKKREEFCSVVKHRGSKEISTYSCSLILLSSSAFQLRSFLILITGFI